MMGTAPKRSRIKGGNNSRRIILDICLAQKVTLKDYKRNNYLTAGELS